MFGRNKGFTASQSKRMERQMNSAELGSHVVRKDRNHNTEGAGAPQNASTLDLSSVRKNQRTTRGVVDQVRLDTASGETASEYAHRRHQRQFAQEAQHQAHRRTIIVIAIAVAFVVACATAVGVMTFFGTVDADLSLDGEFLSQALKEPEEDKPYYVLLAIDLSADVQHVDEADIWWSYQLVRVDESLAQLTFIGLPDELYIPVDGGDGIPLREHSATFSVAETISAVSEFAGVDIAHYVETDLQGIKKMLDLMGGIEMEIVEDVDDPIAGVMYLPSGWRSVGSGSVDALLRASNFARGEETQARHRAALTAALLEEFAEFKGPLMADLLEKCSTNLSTDMDSWEIMRLGEVFEGYQASKAMWASVPGYAVNTDEMSFFFSDDDEWFRLMEKIDSGADPQYVDDPTAGIDRSSFTIEIKNGAWIAGGAAQMQEMLTAEGFNVTTIGNVEMGATYPETLVIYNDPAYELCAQSVKKCLNTGRVINGGDYYLLVTNVLVVLGLDWQPIV